MTALSPSKAESTPPAQLGDRMGRATSDCSLGSTLDGSGGLTQPTDQIVSFTHKVAIFAQHGKNITLTWKGNIFIKDMKEEFCFDMERHPEGRHFNTQARNSMTRDNNDRISLARDNTSFTLNVKEAQYADQGNYTCTLYFDDGEGSLIIELKVVASTAPLNSSSVTNLSSNPTVWLLMIIPLLLIVFLLFLRWKKGAMKRRNTSSCLHPSRAYRFRHIESQSQISFSTEVH
ncbi:Erythroid membrane-associated protein [Varanus komodoensis]|nr:Erythroid membrane-associated protein [Varanus komodoensis]